MHRNDYCNKYEVQQLVLLSGIIRSLVPVIHQTDDKKWLVKLKTVSTYLTNILKERIALVPLDKQKALARRGEHTIVKVMTSDEHKMEQLLNKDKGTEFLSCDKTVTMPFEDYLDLMELSSQACLRCPQGDRVKDCKWRALFGRHGTPVSRENPCAGQCEYRWDDEIRFTDPLTLERVEIDVL